MRSIFDIPIDDQLRLLALARESAAHGARVLTISLLTGLIPYELARLVRSARKTPPRGRQPTSPEWYHKSNLLRRSESSILMATYCRLRDLGFGAEDSLLGAYRQYAGLFRAPLRISFDRAFELASHIEGRWLVQVKGLALARCPTCRLEFVTAVGVVTCASDECPFCKLTVRFRADARVRDSLPMPPIPDLSWVEAF
jgi:hypothetical protein